MPLNLMTLTGEKGVVHVNPANIASVEPREEGGSKVSLNNGVSFLVKDEATRIVRTANAHPPDGN